MKKKKRKSPSAGGYAPRPLASGGYGLAANAQEKSPRFSADAHAARLQLKCCIQSIRFKENK